MGQLIEWAFAHGGGEPIFSRDAAVVPFVQRRKLDEFTRGFIEAALSMVPDDEGKAHNKSYDIADIVPSTLREMVDDCKDFQESNVADLEEYRERGRSDTDAGYDFFLTRNGHGAGFWAPRLGALGERLTKAAKVYGSFDLYVGENGKLYGNG